jgi:hypothetical protein
VIVRVPITRSDLRAETIMVQMRMSVKSDAREQIQTRESEDEKINDFSIYFCNRRDEPSRTLEIPPSPTPEHSLKMRGQK